MCHRFLVVMLLCVKASASKPSIIPPFDDILTDGTRHVKDWDINGTASIHRRFIRLTTQNPRSVGWAWLKSKLNDTQVTALARFRITGESTDPEQALALWVTSLPNHVAGALYGLTSQFIGVGVTLTPLEGSKMHEVSVIVNKGDNPMRTVVGCHVAIRTPNQEGFTSLRWTSIKVTIFSSHLVVEVDPSTRGAYQPCATLHLQGEYSLPAGWLPVAHLGLTANTPMVTGNIHDLATLAVHEFYAGMSGLQTQEPTTAEQTLISNWDHHLIGIQDDLRRTLDTVALNENATDERIETLERNLRALVDADWDRRIAAIEQVNARALSEKKERLLYRIAEAEKHGWQHLQGTLEALEEAVDHSLAAKLEGRVAAAEQRLQDLTQTHTKALEEAMVTYINLKAARASQRLSTAWWLPFGAMLIILGTMTGNVWCCLGWVGTRLVQRQNRCV